MAPTPPPSSLAPDLDRVRALGKWGRIERMRVEGNQRKTVKK